MGKKILVVAVSTLIGLLTVESGLRLSGTVPGVTRLEINLRHGSFQSSRDPLLRYVPRPGSVGVNSYGIRDHDYDRKKPAGVERILVIGDSIGYGFCNDRESLNLDDLFMKQLERNLRDVGPMPIEVINLCVSGYDTVQEVEFLVKKGLDLDPDLVLVAYCLNDDFDASMELNMFRRHPQFDIESRIGQRLFLSSHLVRLLWLKFADPQSGPRKAPPQETVSRTERGFRRLAALARKHGFQPLVVVFPFFEPYDRYRWHGTHRRVAELAAQYDIPVLDLLEPFLAASGGDLKQLQGRCNREHPDETGHDAAAIAIQDYLQETGALRLPPAD